MKIIDGFRQWLTEEGKAPSTVASYVNDVKKFDIYRKQRSTDEAYLTRFLFVRYKQYLEENSFAISTINKKVNSLKVYNDFLLRQNLVDEVFINLKKDKVSIASGSEKAITALDEIQVEQFLFHLESESERNKLIGYLLLYTGVRVSELVHIKLDDIDILARILTVRGKGGKIREISLRQDVLEALMNYQKGERACSKFTHSNYVLVSQRAERLHRDAVRGWIKKVGEQLGFPLHPHLFRHTFCTRLLRRGVDLTTVSKIAGHSSVNMTVKYYIQTSREEKQSAVDML